MEENYKELLSASLRAVDDWWEATINRPNGSTHAACFIRKFVSRLESYQHTMENEAREEGTRLSAVNFSTAEGQIQQAAGEMFGRATKVRAACENYRGLVNRECELYIEKVRRDKAADLYGV